MTNAASCISQKTPTCLKVKRIVRNVESRLYMLYLIMGCYILILKTAKIKGLEFMDNEIKSAIEIDHCKDCYYYCWEICNNTSSDNFGREPVKRCHLWIPDRQGPVNRRDDND